MKFASFKNTLLAAAFLAATAVTANAQKKTVIIEENPNQVFTATEKAAEFPGGLSKFLEYTAKNARYPELAKQNGVKGKVILSFVVEKDGSLTDIKVVRGIGSGCDEEAVRLVKNSPKWIPAAQDGKVVRELYHLPISFGLESNYKIGKIKSRPGDDAAVFTETEVAASFPGGIKQFFAYLGKVVHYPEAARKGSVQGKVLLAFIVEKDGSLSNIEVKKGIGAGCDEEAVRALKNGPKWTPAKQNGRIVRAEYKLPVNFSLQKV